MRQPHGRLRLGCVVLLAASACAGEGIVDPVAPAPSCTDAAPFRAGFDCIQQFVLTPTCAIAGCHLRPGAEEGMDLSAGNAYAQLVDSLSNQAFPAMDRVEPGDPNNSYLILKLEGTDPRMVGNRMPFGGPFLSQAEIDVIRQWILDGAPP